MVEAGPTSPMSKPTWTYYINPAQLATSSIYNQHDLDQLRERIMFPIERLGLLKDIVRKMRVHLPANEESALNKLLNGIAVDNNNFSMIILVNT